MAPGLAPELAALQSSDAQVRLSALRALRSADLRPVAQQLKPLLADSFSEVRHLAEELATSLDLEPGACGELPSSKLTEERKEALRCGKTWKCLCVAGFGVDPAARGLDPWPDAPEASPPSAAISPRPVRRRSCAPEQHWVVRDALAFTAKPLQGDVLVQLLQNEEPTLKESALRALGRLLPALWQRHAKRVAEMLEDQVRGDFAALAMTFAGAGGPRGSSHRPLPLGCHRPRAAGASRRGKAARCRVARARVGAAHLEEAETGTVEEMEPRGAFSRLIPSISGLRMGVSRCLGSLLSSQ